MGQFSSVHLPRPEVAESITGVECISCQQERVQWGNYQTRNEAQQDILNYIVMFYSSQRLHSYLGYTSPNQYESPLAQLAKAA